MGTKPTTLHSGRRLAWLGLACLVVAAFWVLSGAGQEERAGAADQPPAGDAKDLPEKVALAEKQVAIKRAAVKIVDAQKGVAEAKVSIAKSSIESAKAALVAAEAEVQRLRKLVATGVVDTRTLNEADTRLVMAKAAVAEAEGKILLAEREVAVE